MIGRRGAFDRLAMLRDDDHRDMAATGCRGVHSAHARVRARTAEALRDAAGGFLSSATLRRSASMRLTTRCGAAKTGLGSNTAPACRALRWASSPSSCPFPTDQQRPLWTTRQQSRPRPWHGNIFPCSVDQRVSDDRVQIEPGCSATSPRIGAAGRSPTALPWSN
jgi:hypothetical protein